MKILAIDQASKISGWSVFENGELIEYGKVTFNDDDFILRVSKLRSWLNEFIDDNSIEKVILEDIQLQIDKESQQVVYGEGNIVNVQTFKKLAGLQAVLYELCLSKDIPVEIYHSSAWKSTCKITGQHRQEQKSPVEIYHSSAWKSTCKITGQHRQEQKRSAQNYILNKYGVKVIQDIADAICLGEHACSTSNNITVQPIQQDIDYQPMTWE